MHYYIDGYNLLFRLLPDAEDLQSERESIIHDLNKKISLIKLDASVVFDAAFQIGGRSRSHYDALEILYTAEGETADDYILNEIHHSPRPKQETVITSDKNLARQVRMSSGHTQTVEEFMQWLMRSYKNKLRQLKKSPQSAIPSIPVLPPAKPKEIIPSKGAPLEAYADYYARHFEAEWQEIQKKEQLAKQAASSAVPVKRPPRKPRQKKDPFQQPASPEVQEVTEMERWLKLFERRSNENS